MRHPPCNGPPRVVTGSSTVVRELCSVLQAVSGSFLNEKWGGQLRGFGVKSSSNNPSPYLGMSSAVKTVCLYCWCWCCVMYQDGQRTQTELKVPKQPTLARGVFPAAEVPTRATCARRRQREVPRSAPSAWFCFLQEFVHTVWAPLAYLQGRIMCIEKHKCIESSATCELNSMGLFVLTL